MAQEFNPKENSVVGYVNAQGEVLLGIVNDVSGENPNLAVVTQVTNPGHDATAKVPGTWHYLDEAKLAELQAPPASEEPTPPIEPVEPASPEAESETEVEPASQTPAE